MTSNYQHVTKGFEILTGVLAPYVGSELRARFGDEWWGQGVLGVLYDKRGLPPSGRDANLIANLDAYRCLILMDVQWNDHFSGKLDREHRTWIKELMGTRNKWAHKGQGDMTNDDAWRALDTMTRLVEQIAPEATEQLRELSHSIRYETRKPIDVAPDHSLPRPAMTSSIPAQDNELTVEQILECLEWHRTRATYGAVGKVIGVLPQEVSPLLGTRQPRASWVVNAHTGEPTSYSPDEKHPDLKHNPYIIRTGEELRELCVKLQHKDRKAR